MSRVTELGYLGLSVSKLSDWKEYATRIVGMELVDEGETDRVYLRMDQWHHRITLHADGGDDLSYMGWRVPGPVELDELAQKLERERIAFRRGTEAEAHERRVLGLLKMTDPGGIGVEVFYGPQVDSHKPFHPGRPMFGRFLTGEQGLGHCIVRELDCEAAVRFYQALGLSGSVEYKLQLPNGMVAAPIFMHVNGRQHSIAFGMGPAEKRVNHLMIEYTNLKDLGYAHDAIRKRKIDVALQLGMHSNDEALTFYCANPSGWVWELGWGARETPKQQEHHVRDVFGHGPEATGYGLDLDLSA